MWCWVTACGAYFRIAAGAILASLATVGSFALLVTSLGLLLEPEKLWHEEGMSILDCLPCGDRAITLFRREPLRGSIVTTELASHDLSADEPAWQLRWPALNPSRIASSPTGDRLFFGLRDGSILTAGTGREVSRPKLLGRHDERDTLDLLCSADGTRLISLGWSSVNLWELESATLRWRRDDVAANCCAWNSDTGNVVCGLREGQIVELAGETGQTVREFMPLACGVREMELNRESGLLACVGDNGAVHIFQWPSGSLAWRSNKSPGHVGGGSIVRFSNDGRQLVTASPENICSLAIWDVKTGQRLGDLRGHTEAILSGRFAGDGRFMSWGTDGTIRIWNIDRRTTERVISLVGSPQPTNYSPLFASADGTFTRHR